MKTSNNIIYTTSIHWICYIFPSIKLILGLFGLLVFFTAGGTIRIISFFLVILFFKALIQILELISIKIYITSELICYEKGFMSKMKTDISLRSINGIAIYQNFFGNLLNYGNFVISSAGVNENIKIANPMQLREKILQNKY